MTVTPRIEDAHERAVKRLEDAHASVRKAFDDLDCGLTFDDLIAYVEPAHAQLIRVGSVERAHAKLVGFVAGAALTIVEADRARRG